MGVFLLAAHGSLIAESTDRFASLSDLLDAALRNNPQLQAVESQYLAATQQAGQVSALPDPKLSVTHFVESIETRTGPQENAISISQGFPWFGTLQQREAAANIEAAMLYHAWQEQQLAIAREVALQWFELGYLQEAIALSEENLDLLQKLETLETENLRAGGALNRLLKVQVESGKFEDQLLQLKETETARKARLASLLGRPDLNFALGATLPQPPALPEAFNRSVSVEHHPLLQKLQTAVESAEARLKLAELSRYPDFTAGLTYIQTGDAAVPSARDSGKDPWSITIAVNLPIWRGKYDAAEEAAVQSREAASRRYEQARLDLLTQYSSHTGQLKDATHRLQRYQDSLIPTAKQATAITRTSYENNKATLLDLIDSQRTELELELARLRITHQIWSHIIELKTISGAPLNDAIGTVID